MIHGEIEKQRWQGHTLSNQTRSFLLNFKLFAKNLFGEVQDHAFIGSKLSKQPVQVQLTRTQ